MTTFVAESLKPFFAAALCFGLLSAPAPHTVSAQDNAAKAKDDSSEQDFEIGQASSAKEYEVLQKQAVQQINLNDGFLTAKILADYRKHEVQYRAVLRTGPNKRNPEDQTALQAGLDYRSLVLSDPAIQEDIVLFEGCNQNLKRDVSNAAPQGSVQNTTTRKNIRRQICQIAFDNLKKIITEGNFLGRSTALEQLLNLEVVSGRNRQRVEMFDQVDQLLVEVLNDPNQPDAVKLRAVNVMKKYLQKADPPAQTEMAFAAAIISELQEKWLAMPYQNSLLTTLEWVRPARQIVGGRDPIVICAMVDLMQNKEIDVYVRCRATRVLGRAGFDRNINFEPLAWATARLTQDVALQYFQANAKDDPKWRWCGWFLYTAFHHENSKEASGNGGGMPKGFLNRAADSELIRTGYEAAVPVMAHLMSGDSPKGIGRVSSPLIKWVKETKPTNLKADPACPPVSTE